jgi:hypothetical protein
MNDTTISPAIDVYLVEPTMDQFARERRAFLRLLPGLLQSHRGQYAAIHNEQVAGTGPDRLKLALEVQGRVRSGVYVGHIIDEPEPIHQSGIRRNLGGWRDAR